MHSIFNLTTLTVVATTLVTLGVPKGFAWIMANRRKDKESSTEQHIKDKNDKRVDRETWIAELLERDKLRTQEFDKYRADVDLKIQRMEEKYERREEAHVAEIEKKNKQISELEGRVDFLEEELYKAKVAIEIKEEAKVAIHQSIEENLNPIIKT